MPRRSKVNSHNFRMLFVYILLLPVTVGCIGPRYWDGYVGKVVDIENEEPLEGVFVIARYWGDIPAPGHSNTTCYHATGTTTNAKGEYRMNPHLDMPDIYIGKRSDIDFYKPGYRSVYYKDGVAKLEKDKGSREERLKYLRSVAGNTCSGAGKSQQALFPYYESIYYEAKVIADSKEDKKLLSLLRWWAASQAIASDEEQGLNGSEYDQLIKGYLKDNLQ